MVEVSGIIEPKARVLFYGRPRNTHTHTHDLINVRSVYLYFTSQSLSSKEVIQSQFQAAIDRPAG